MPAAVHDQASNPLATGSPTRHLRSRGACLRQAAQPHSNQKAVGSRHAVGAYLRAVETVGGVAPAGEVARNKPLRPLRSPGGVEVGHVEARQEEALLNHRVQEWENRSRWVALTKSVGKRRTHASIVANGTCFWLRTTVEKHPVYDGREQRTGRVPDSLCG